ncbi:DNA cytosine methyltransferase [Peribacillus saganii]|uniref:Cytosine-specific methyltransferase n=1 Tax=Peribacillus saganii TaxID=2303992 RepID=A0A372LD46_9BACI|nr:DNA cytosine methyltransferase [Peribacillus saganii]RFU63683.1 DNA cytosine methyltransferase [Peribacillus saganii]
MKTAISLFAGAGGCSLGFKEGGFDIVAAYDNNAAAINTYNKNFGENKSKLVDLSACDFKELRAGLGLKPGDLDLIIGGPPCQGFSSAGTRFWDDIRNKLLKNYAEALEEFKPKWFFMENVEGLLTTGKGEYVYEAVKKFAELGYSIVLKKVYAQEYGVPQRRKRVIIIGNRLGINFSFPKPIHSVTGPIFRNSPITLRTTIEDLEAVKIPEIDHLPKEESGINFERYSYLKPGQTMRDLPAELQHDSFKKRSLRRVKDGTPSHKRGGAPSGLKRLIYDEPALTITSAASREFVHPVQNRTLTMRECARLQTFPDHFVFTGSDGAKMTQIGNAIPPKLAQIFAQHINEVHGKAIRKGEIGKIRGGLISFNLTKATAMSPALKKTSDLLNSLLIEKSIQEELFNGNYETTKGIL